MFWFSFLSFCVLSRIQFQTELLIYCLNLLSGHPEAKSILSILPSEEVSVGEFWPAPEETGCLLHLVDGLDSWDFLHHHPGDSLCSFLYWIYCFLYPMFSTCFPWVHRDFCIAEYVYYTRLGMLGILDWKQYSFRILKENIAQLSYTFQCWFWEV